MTTTAQRLDINLEDVAAWLRTLPEATQFNMNVNDECLFYNYLKITYPDREVICVGTVSARLDDKIYDLDRTVSSIIAELLDRDVTGEEDLIVSRDEALSTIEQFISYYQEH